MSSKEVCFTSTLLVVHGEGGEGRIKLWVERVVEGWVDVAQGRVGGGREEPGVLVLRVFREAGARRRKLKLCEEVGVEREWLRGKVQEVSR